MEYVGVACNSELAEPLLTLPMALTFIKCQLIFDSRYFPRTRTL